MLKDHGRFAIVGGGIAGLSAALLLATKGHNVSLLERSSHLGGLMQSYRSRDGWVFDRGNRLLSPTGIDGLDDLLFSALDAHGWIKCRARAAIFFNGKLDRNSQIIDARSMPRTAYERGIRDLSHAKPLDRAPRSLRDQFHSIYGDTFTTELFAPIMRKLAFAELEELAPDSHMLFGLSHLGLGTREDIVGLQIPQHSACYVKILDDSHPSTQVNVIYPARGGIDQWIAHLQERLALSGATVILGDTVANIDIKDDHAIGLRLASGRYVPADTIVWTGSPAELIRVSGLIGTHETIAPTRLLTVLLHFLSNEPLAETAHFVTYFDSSFCSFRATLYSNVQKEAQPPHRLTLEVLRPSKADLQILLPTVVSELVDSGVARSQASLRLVHSEQIPNTFPKPTVEYYSKAKFLIDAASNLFPNVILLGRAQGTTFFTDGVIREVHASLAKFLT